jgi:rod shape-determining protein MreC
MSVTALDPRRRMLLFAAVMVGHLVLISAQVNTRSGVRVLSAVTFGAFAGVQRAASSVLGAVTGTWSRYFALHDVAKENEKLKQQIVDLGVKLQEQRALALRGQRLELLMKMQSAIPQRTIAADVIAGDASSFFRTVTINRGTKDGLRRDLAVIAPAGVVGRVVGDPASRAARVQLLIDRSAGAGALIERSRAGGVVVGDGGGLRLEYVSGLADIVVGDVVVTSGLDGIYPKGFVIGTVVSVEAASGGTRTIVVRPRVDFSALEEVLVVLDARGAPPTGGSG